MDVFCSEATVSEDVSSCAGFSDADCEGGSDEDDDSDEDDADESACVFSSVLSLCWVFDDDSISLCVWLCCSIHVMYLLKQSSLHASVCTS